MTVQRRVINKTTASRTGDSAHEYLLRGWFPVNGSLLRDIRDRLNKGEYAADPARLISDLKNDFALLSYTIRSVKDLGKRLEEVPNPVNLISTLTQDELKMIFASSEGDISTHSFSDMLKPQALRFKHSVIGCSTSEAIAEKTGVDPDFAHFCSFLRQLGLHLAAWNYPRIYAKAITSLATSADDLDALLVKGVGFSPRAMGIRLIFSNMHPDLKAGLGLNGTDEKSAGAAAAQICEIGEAFAKLNDPEHYPHVTREWKTIVSDINHYLGPKGISIIRERVEANCANYIAAAPKVFDTDISPEKNVELANQYYAQTLLTTNGFASKCNEELQDRLRRVYAKIRPGQVSTEAIQVLVNDVIPSAGFLRGCVYLLDGPSQVLVPRLRIGDKGLERYKSLVCSTAEFNENPIVDALYSALPVKQENALLFGERVGHVSGSIGNGDKTGVLYLEMSEKLVEEGGLEPVQRFKAIRQALNDCLNLN